jgi:hypothetical protein
MQVVRRIDDLSAGRPFFLMQDARRIGTGVDVAYAYLLYWRGLSDLAVAQPQGADTPVFVILDHRSRLRPQPALLLKNLQPAAELNHLTLYQIPPDQRTLWLQTLHDYPPP